jgi:hypothetical protein
MGLDALRMKHRISMNINTDITPDNNGDRNQDPTAKQNVSSFIHLDQTKSIRSVHPQLSN